MPLLDSSQTGMNVSDWLALLVAIVAAIISLFAYLTSKTASNINKTDIEFQNCYTLRLKAQELWERYIALQNMPSKDRSTQKESDALLDILGHIEWVLIYIQSRKLHTSLPIQNLKSETMRPLERLLSTNNDGGAFLVETIINNKDCKDTFIEIERELRRKNISLYIYLARNSK